ncbi:hypothetical protein DSO57_1019254 [Entomophthora muscae]|uniref:Uncharacterized protein n=1 Tax=Entomophthora muscae TaxID=34485 RepID=A0ACC2UDF8_9FUNG|nr:hypothetical protein DSO57_1019254 [Entomophthora muscae]
MVYKGAAQNDPLVIILIRWKPVKTLLALTELLFDSWEDFIQLGLQNCECTDICFLLLVGKEKEDQGKN